MKINSLVSNYILRFECVICHNNLMIHSGTPDVEKIDKIVFSEQSVVCCDHEYKASGVLDTKLEVNKIEVSHIEAPKETKYKVGYFYKAKWEKDGSIEPIMYCDNGYWLSSGSSIESKDDSFHWIDSQPLNLGE